MRKLTKIEEVNKKALGKNSALFHVTKTILNKSIQDCNSDLRTLLKAHNILDYDELGEGSKVTLKGKFADGSETNISCYRAKTRGDKRIWFSGIKDHARIDDIMAMIEDISPIGTSLARYDDRAKILLGFLARQQGNAPTSSPSPYSSALLSPKINSRLLSFTGGGFS